MADTTVVSENRKRQPLYAEEYGGHGRPMLLLHGLGAAGSIWAQVAGLLAPHRRVLVPDLLGFGRSPWPDAQYTVDDHLDALDRLLEERGLRDCMLDIAGHSMGAVLAAEFAARNPERIGKVVLVSLPYFGSGTEVRDVAARLGLLAKLTVSDRWSAKAICSVMCVLRPLLIFLAPSFARALPPQVARDGLRHNFTSYSRSLQNVVVNHRLDDALASLSNRSILLLHGDEDRVAPLENVSELATRFPQWRLDVVASSGHLLPIEQPERVSQWLMETA